MDFTRNGLAPEDHAGQALSVLSGTKPVNTFEAELQQRLEALERQNLFRKLRRVSSPQGTRIIVDGRELLNFSSNDYLGLATHPKLKAAAIEATERYGTGCGASRLICGSLE